MYSTRYPYMSCEVICLEVPSIINTIINSNSKYLLKLFSLLDAAPPLDNYLAGYFEKVLEMLFRKETDVVMKLINSGETTLFRKFLDHIDNYSIMQIVQRLMLPHIPFSNARDADADPALDDLPLEESCQWSLSEEYCDLLCLKMLDASHLEVSAHISDLLITVVQLALPDSKVISNLSAEKCLHGVLTAAFPKISSPSSDCISLSAVSVLESLVSRLGESFSPESEQASPEELDRIHELTSLCVANAVVKVSEFVGDISQQLGELLHSQASDTALYQSRTRAPRLGYRGLQLVKLVESLTRLDNDEIDLRMCESGILAKVVDLLLHFQHNSILHLSVQRIVSIFVQNSEHKR